MKGSMRKGKKNMKQKSLLVCISIAVLFLLTACSSKDAEPKIIPNVPVSMVNGVLYFGADEGTPMGDSGCVIGHITSVIDKDAIPTEDGQANYGAVGDYYTEGGDVLNAFRSTDDCWQDYFSEEDSWYEFYSYEEWIKRYGSKTE